MLSWLDFSAILQHYGHKKMILDNKWSCNKLFLMGLIEKCKVTINKIEVQHYGHKMILDNKWSCNKLILIGLI